TRFFQCNSHYADINPAAPSETPGSVLFKKLDEEPKRTPKKVVSFPRPEALMEAEGAFSEGGGSLPRYKSHSTATNFATSTLSQPDLNQVLWWYSDPSASLAPHPKKASFF